MNNLDGRGQDLTPRPSPPITSNQKATMLSHDDRQAAEEFIQHAQQSAGATFVLRYSVTTEKWVTPSPQEAGYYERNYPGHLLRPERVPFHLEGDAWGADDGILIVQYDQVMKPGEVPTSSRSTRVVHVPASRLGILLRETPAEMIVHNGPSGLDVYRRTLVMRRAGQVGHVTYKTARIDAPIIVLEGDRP